MRRVVAFHLIAGVLALGAALSGCSMGSIPLSSGILAGDEDADQGPRNDDKLGWLGKKAKAQPVATVIAEVASTEDASPAVDPAASSNSLIDASQPHLDANKALALINAYRQENGLPALTLDPMLTRAAKAHSRDLAKTDKISHIGSDGSNPWDRVKRTGYGVKLAAENIGTGQKSVEEVIEGWKGSDAHNRNLLLTDAQSIGIALVYDAKTANKTFWTLVVGAAL